MRLNRLDLLRYGRFQDTQLTFPKPAAGASDVTVVFGPNEAGKSTAFQALLELLFGMKAGAHPYAFRFDRSDLLVGAQLELPGRGAVTLRRNGKRQRSLLDGQGQPVEEAILTSALHGLTQDAFVERFSLNDASLRDGGKRIAEAQGDLGQLLHAGVSGLTGVAQVLTDLESLADGFHKKGGRGTVLKKAKDRLAEIRRDLRDAALTPDKERALTQKQQAAQSAFALAEQGLHRARLAQAAGAAAQIWFEQTQHIDQIDAGLAMFATGPDLPAGAEARITALVTHIQDKQDRINEACAKLDRLAAEIAALPSDALAPALAAELRRLEDLTIDGAPLKDRASTAQADLDRRMTERQATLAQLGHLTDRLAPAGTAPQALVLTLADLDGLAQLVSQAQTSDTAANQAQQEAARARAALGDAPAAPQDLSALETAYRAWQGLPDPAVSETALQEARMRLAQATAILPETWRSCIDAGLPSPERLHSLARQQADLTAQCQQAAADVETRSAEAAEARADVAAQEAGGARIDAASIERTRQLRDAAWQTHRAALTAADADAFEAAMRADDVARAQFLTGASARERLSTARRVQATAEARLTTSKLKHDRLTQEAADLFTTTADVAKALGLSANEDPATLIQRHTALCAAAEAAVALKTAQTHHDGLSQKAVTCRSALELAAAQAGLTERRPADADQSGALDTQAHQGVAQGDGHALDLPHKVARALAAQDSVAQAWSRWQTAAQGVTRLDQASDMARTQAEQAATALANRLAPIPLAQKKVVAVQAALPTLRDIQRVHADYQAVCHRIDRLETALGQLTHCAQRLAEIGLTVDQPGPFAVIDAATARVAAAARDDQSRAAAEQQRTAETQARTMATQARDAAQADLARGFEEQGGAERPALERLAHLQERDTLRRARRSADQTRQNARAGVDDALFEDELAQLPKATRAAELAQAVTDAQAARDTARDAQVAAQHQLDAAFAEAVRADLVTEQATLTEDLRDALRRAALARLGGLAARGALRRLAAERRSTMVQHVERAFVQMTAPNWKGVDVWSEAEGDKLVGRRQDGTPVPAQNMSTGTMGQLYFALRLAGYHNFANDPGPLPMILDDIMETFDDTRAAAALHLCAEIGTVGQAIMFTHHAHLVELARVTLPDVNVITMPT